MPVFHGRNVSQIAAPDSAAEVVRGLAGLAIQPVNRGRLPICIGPYLQPWRNPANARVRKFAVGNDDQVKTEVVGDGVGEQVGTLLAQNPVMGMINVNNIRGNAVSSLERVQPSNNVIKHDYLRFFTSSIPALSVPPLP